MKPVFQDNQTDHQIKIYRNKNLYIIFSVTMMVLIAVTSISPAFPQIIKELNIPAQNVGLLISAYTLPMAVLTFFFGILADRMGRKKILVPMLMLFGISGSACSLTHDFNILLILRFVQGVAGAPFMPLGVTLIDDIYSGKHRDKVIGYNVSVLNLSAAIYPAIGGALAVVGWNYPFLLSILAIPIGLVVLFSLKNPESKNNQQVGEYLRTAGRGMKNRHVIGLLMSSFVAFFMLYGTYLTFFPIFIGYTFGANSFVIGLLVSVMFLTASIISTQQEKLAKIYPEKNLIKASFILYALALIATALVPNIWLVFITVVAYGVAHGIIEPSIHILLMSLTPVKCRGISMAVNWTFIRSGQTIAPVMLGLVFVIWGITNVLLVSAIISIAMALLVTIVLK